jgi:uncharacterized protein YkwD
VLRLVLVACLMSAAFSAAQACTRLREAPALRSQLLAEVNARRANNRMIALAGDPRLEEAAFAIACENATRNRLSHTTADGSTLTGRVRAVRYGWRLLNENLAQTGGAAAPATVVQLWMRSPGHRANILTAGTRHFGAGIARSRSGAVFWAMVSAAPR